MSDITNPPPPAPPSGTTSLGARTQESSDDLDLLICVLARTKGRRWQLVAQHFDSRTDAERAVRALRARLPEVELRVAVVGFPEEHADELPEDASTLVIGDILADLLATQEVMVGLLDDDARGLTREQLRVRRLGTQGLRIVRGGG